MKKDSKVQISFSIIKLNTGLLGPAASKPKKLAIFENEKNTWNHKLTTKAEKPQKDGFEFEESLPIVFIFEKKQVLRADFIEQDSNLVIGSTTFELGKIIGSKKNFTIRPIVDQFNQELAALVLRYSKEDLKKKSTYTTYENKQKEFKKQASIADNEEYDFLDYLQGGLEIALVIGIDFTGSNGIPSRPESLHAINLKGSQMNPYEKAITGVGEVLLDYDKDKLVPTYGFGAKPKFPGLTSKLTSHCFPCSGDPSNSEAYTIDGVLSMYKNAVTKVELSGPTFFAPLLQEVKNVVSECMESGSDVYTILLIITDGDLHDMQESIDIIVDLSYMPCSIIICGVGKAEFSQMVALDSDDELLVSSNGREGLRDIVQFVPFNEFNDQETLSACVLEEIPSQVSSYYSYIKKKPNPVVSPSNKDFEEEYSASKMPSFGPPTGGPFGYPGFPQPYGAQPFMPPQYSPNPAGFMPPGTSSYPSGGYNYPSMGPGNGATGYSVGYPAGYPGLSGNNASMGGNPGGFLGASQPGLKGSHLGYPGGGGFPGQFGGANPSSSVHQQTFNIPGSGPNLSYPSAFNEETKLPGILLCESDDDTAPPPSKSKVYESQVIKSGKIFMKPSSISNLSSSQNERRKQNTSPQQFSHGSLPGQSSVSFPRK